MLQTPSRQKHIVILSGAHDKILKNALYPYHFLTATQICRVLGYRLTTITTIRERLKQLTDNKYLHSFYLPLPQKQRPYVYALSMQGRRYLESEGMDVTTYYKPAEQEVRSYGFLMHTLELNEFIILAKLLEAQEPNLSLFDFQHDFTIKKTPITTLDAKGKIIKVIPDAFLDMRTAAGKRACFLVELDRGTEGNEKFRRKIADSITSLQQGTLTKHFLARKLTILYVTTAGHRRVEQMRNLTRLELKAQGIAADSYKAQMFKFATLPPLIEEPADPETIFCTPYWLSAYGDPTELETLIDLA